MEKPSFHPNLTGKVTPEAKLAIDTLFDRVKSVAKGLDTVKGAILSAADVKGHVGPEASQQLTIAGNNPLNVEGLLGQLSQPQKAAATPVTALPGPQDPLSQNGQIIYFNHRLYWFDASTDPGVWRLLGQTIIIDTHAVRLTNYPAADNPFSIFFETDRTVLFASDGVHWLYVAGEMLGTAAPSTRPVDLGSFDVGFPFHAGDIGETFYWTGNSWGVRTEIPTALYDTHENRTFNGVVDVTSGTHLGYVSGPAFSTAWIGKRIMVGGAIRTVVTIPSGVALTIDGAVPNGAGQLFNLYEYASVNFPKGTMFFESDRTVYYSVRDIALTVTVAGGVNVTVTGGRALDNRWIGAVVDVAGTPSTIFAVISSSSAILAVAVPDGAGQTLTVPSGIWQYASGQYADLLANIPTGFLADDFGFIFYSTDYEHSYRWSFVTGTFVWRYGPGDPGSNWLCAGQKGEAIDGGLWGLCDGSTYTRSTAAGLTTSVVTRNLANGDVIRAGDSPHDPGTSPTWAAGAKTDIETSLFAFGAVTAYEAAHTHDVSLPSDSTDAGAAAPFNFADPSLVTSGPGTPHNHPMSNTDAPQLPHKHDLGADAVINPDGFPPNTGVSWYIRL